MRRRRVRWKIQLMTWRLETTTGMWKEKEQAARTFANAVVKSGLRGWVESDIVGIRAIVDMEMGGTLRTYKQAFKGASEGAHFACEDASIAGCLQAACNFTNGSILQSLLVLVMLDPLGDGD